MVRLNDRFKFDSNEKVTPFILTIRIIEDWIIVKVGEERRLRRDRLLAEVIGCRWTKGIGRNLAEIGDEIRGEIIGVVQVVSRFRIID